MNPIHSKRLWAAVAALAAGALISCAGAQIPATQITDPGEMLFNGHTVAAVDCFKCHGGDATGTLRGPNLTEKVTELTDPQIAKIIDEGDGRMPSFHGRLDATQVAQITGWLRSRAAAIAKK